MPFEPAFEGAEPEILLDEVLGLIEPVFGDGNQDQLGLGEKSAPDGRGKRQCRGVPVRTKVGLVSRRIVAANAGREGVHLFRSVISQCRADGQNCARVHGPALSCVKHSRSTR